MRSRPDLELFLLPKNPVAGSRMRAEAVLESSSETPIDGVEFHLEGLERRHTGTAMVGKVPVAKYATAVHVNLFGRTPATTLAEGKHRFAMTFDVPPAAPPSYRSHITTVEYTLSVRVVIPWWPDRVGRYVVAVSALPRDATSRTVSYCTDDHGPRGSDLYIEASLDRTAVAPGEGVSGAASLGNVDQHRIKRVELSFVAMERVAGTNDAGDEVERYTIVIHEGAPADSKPIPFRVKFPEHAVPGFRGALAELWWRAEIRAVISFGSDVCLSIPLEVLSRAAGSPIAPAPSRVPPVGRDRRARVWAAVAQQHGFSNDADEERMRRDLGSGALEITLEPRREGGLATLARLRFPPLGIDLSVAEKRWTDVIASRAVASGHEGFDHRFTARGREAAQVRAFLDEATCEALTGFERATVDDGGATLEAECAAQSVEELEPVIARALKASQALLAAAHRIPPPAAMSSCVPEWQEVAALTNGRLQIGRMAIRQAVFDHFSFELVTQWSEDGEPTGTVARLFLPAVEGNPARLTGVAREIAAAISQRVESLNVTRDRVEATFPAPMLDPRTILPAVEGIAQLARVLEGKTTRGPYR